MNKYIPALSILLCMPTYFCAMEPQPQPQPQAIRATDFIVEEELPLPVATDLTQLTSSQIFRAGQGTQQQQEKTASQPTNILENLSSSQILHTNYGPPTSIATITPITQQPTTIMMQPVVAQPLSLSAPKNTTLPSTLQSPPGNAMLRASLSQSTLAERKRVALIQSSEQKPWKICGVINAFRDATAIALSEIYYLKGKPENITEVSHKLEWGINDTISKITDIRKYNKPIITELPRLGINPTPEEIENVQTITASNKRNQLDSLLKILRAEREHVKNLDTIIQGAYNNDINLNEAIESRAYKCLQVSKLEALLYEKLALQESKEYLRQDKQLRSNIYHVKLDKSDIDVPSDDDYDDPSLWNHYTCESHSETLLWNDK